MNTDTARRRQSSSRPGERSLDCAGSDPWASVLLSVFIRVLLFRAPLRALRGSASLDGVENCSKRWRGERHLSSGASPSSREPGAMPFPPPSTLRALCILVLGVQWAPRAREDASRIAFASRRDGNWEIYVMDADGGHQTRLTTRPQQDRFPLWSPDGAQLAFGSQRPDGWELWVMGADGSNPRRLSTDIAAKGFRQWSPDGTRIAFESGRAGQREIYTV